MMNLGALQAAATEHRLARLEAQLADMLEEVQALRARARPAADLESTAKAEAAALGDTGVFASALLPMLRARQAERERRAAR